MKKLLPTVLLVGLVLMVLAACTLPATPSVAPTVAPTSAPAPTKPAATKPAQQPEATPKPAVTSKPKPPEGKPYYEGKTLEIMVDSSAGGGTDAVARIIATHWPKHIPGNPKIIVRNQPGGQGSIANNAFFKNAKPDGLTLLMNSSGTLALQMTGESIVGYDFSKYRHVGNVARGASIVMVRAGLKDKMADTTIKPLVVGTSRDAAESWQAVLLWGKDLLGWNIRWIPGFGSSTEMQLAFRRGEMDIFATSNAFIVRNLIQERLVDTIATIGIMRQGKFLRRPDFPDVPTFEEFLGNKKPTGISWQAFLVWVGPGLADKLLAAPPNTPDSVMSILTESFTRMTKDLQFDSTVKKMVSEEYDIMVGKETDDLVKEILGAPPEALQFQKELKAKHYK